MIAVLTRARAELRARVPALLALTLLVGLGGGAVMTIAAGARRTDTAYPRFARAYNAADMLVYPAFDETFASLDFDKVAALPQVAFSVHQPFFFTNDNHSYVVDEPPFGETIDRIKIIEGKRPDPNSTDQAMIPYWEAKALHWHVGTTITAGLATAKFSFVPFTFRVVGIEASPGEFPPQLGNNGPNGGSSSVVHITPGVLKELRKKNIFSLDFLLLRLKRGAADIPAVNDALNAMAGGKPQLNSNLNDQAADVQRSIHLQAVALWLVAGLAAAIIALVLSQLIARQAGLDATENPTLLALGMSRPQVWFAGMARALVIGAGGAALAVLIAFLASPLMPLGVARIAEPTPGFSFDARLLVVAAASVIVLVLALAAWPIWKRTRLMQREARATAKPSLAARTAAAPILSPAAGTGVRHALESGRGRTEVPVRSSLFSVILAITALAGALTFGASLDHLLSTPRLYGLNWDVYLTTAKANDNTPALSVLKNDPRVEDIADLDTPPVNVNAGKPDSFRLDAVGLQPEKGDIQAVTIDGRAPHLPTEVAMGVKTLRRAHLKIGDQVPLNVSAISDSPTQLFTVVGTVVVPPYSSSARLGSGIIVTEDGFKRMTPPGFQIPATSDLFMRFAPGVDKKAVLADIMSKTVTWTEVGDDGKARVRSAPMSEAYDVVTTSKPTDLVNFGNVQNLPLLLAGLVGLLAVGTLAHILVTSIRRRRRDLAVLKVLGFSPAQVRRAVDPWQASVFVLAALVVGLPAGIALGRVVWSVFATNLGTRPEPVTPMIRLLLTIPGALILAGLIAAVPAVLAGRMRPAPALRAE